jgi:outer membrane protein assembly factor BamA
MRSVLVLVVAAAIATWAMAIAHHAPEGQASAEPQTVRAQEVQSVSFDGRSLPIAALRDLVSTRPGELVDAQKLERDRATIQTALEARGFLAAHVAPASVVFASNGGAYVTFVVDQGLPFHIRTVTLTGASERDAVVTISPGDIAVAERIERARQAVADSIPSRGKVTVRMRTNLAASVVDLELVVR